MKLYISLLFVQITLCSSNEEGKDELRHLTSEIFFSWQRRKMLFFSTLFKSKWERKKSFQKEQNQSLFSFFTNSLSEQSVPLFHSFQNVCWKCLSLLTNKIRAFTFSTRKKKKKKNQCSPKCVCCFLLLHVFFLFFFIYTIGKQNSIHGERGLFGHSFEF